MIQQKKALLSNPSELLIYNPCWVMSRVPQSTQSNYGDHNRLWNGGDLSIVLMQKCLRNIFREGTDIALWNRNDDNQFIWMGHFLPSSANRKRCAAAIFGIPELTTLLYSYSLVALSLRLFISTQESLNLPGIRSSHIYSNNSHWSVQTSFIDATSKQSGFSPSKRAGKRGLEWS